MESTKKNEDTIAVTFIRKGENRDLAYEYLDELCELAKTAGAEIVEKFTQELQSPNKATLIGKGKVEEIKEYIDENKVQLVIFDVDLTPMQVRNLEKAFAIKVIDRSGLILDIFAKRASSLEAKTQVELAQTQYLLPRLTRMWTHLSKQFGGIGTKGPGETQIETDKRILRDKIQALKEKLINIELVRETQRKGRVGIPRFALVGYTNSGKSTLMKAITEADVYIKDELFATLDTTVRTFELPGGVKALLSDTVGFIRKLPHHLVASFRSTLAEAAEADVIIHIVDVSLENFRDQLKTVETTLESLDIKDRPVLLVFNKIDKMEERLGITGIKEEYPESVFISATRGINIQGLLDKIKEIYDNNSNDVWLKLPYTEMSKINLLYGCGQILSQDDKEDGSVYCIRLQNDKLSYFKNIFGKYVIKNVKQKP